MAEADAPYTIKVKDADGRLVEGAFVTASAAATTLPELSYETGPDGTVSLRLPHGKVRLMAHREGQAGQLTVCFGPDRRGLDLTIHLHLGAENAGR